MDETKLRDQLIYSLSGKGAHVDFDGAVRNFSQEQIAKRVPGLEHTAWQLLYHLWITQWDILEFSRDPKHESPPWPEGYWPKSDGPDSTSAWDETVAKFRADLAGMKDLVRSPQNDLLAPFPHGDGQTLLREALLVIDHNAYHIGQMVDLRRLLGIWKGR